MLKLNFFEESMKPFDPAKTPIGTRVYMMQCEEGIFVKYEESIKKAIILFDSSKKEFSFHKDYCIEFFKVD